jgi:signal peptidase
LLQVLNFASVLASGLMMYKGLGLVANSESPIVVVLRSGCVSWTVVLV